MRKNMNKDIIVVGDMTCAACAKRVENVVSKLVGVSNASVNFASEKLTVEYDDSNLNVSDIKAAIIEAGYKVIEKSLNNEVIIPIGGMTCVACASRVEKAISKVDGVENVFVNFATEKATVIYNPQRTRISFIKQSIEKAGYSPLEISSSKQVDEDRLRKEKEINTL